MLNKAILMGRLVRDPELRRTQSNTAVASFTLAIDRQRDKDGNRQTDFIDCVAWGKKAEFLTRYFTKGMAVIIVGQIQSRNWEDKNGNKRTTIEVSCEDVSFGETKKNREQTSERAQMPAGGFLGEDSSGFADASDDYDDNDVPF